MNLEYIRRHLKEELDKYNRILFITDGMLEEEIEQFIIENIEQFYKFTNREK